MPDSAVAVYANFALQAALSALLVAVLLALYSHYRHRYLIEWSLSAGCTAVYYVGAITALYLAESGRAGGTRWLLLSYGEFLGIHWAAAFLVIGAWEVAAGREQRPRRAEWLFAALALVALAAVVVDGFGLGREARVLARQGMRGLISGLAYLGSAWILLRAPSWRQHRGLRVVAGTFMAYGLAQFYTLVAAIPGLPPPPFAYYMGFVNTVLAAVAGIGMVVGMLEQERDRTRLASQQIEHLAYHDQLTNLPNRQLFADRLTLALAQPSEAGTLAVLLVNLDRFKVVNDALGRSVGDELLRAAAGRIGRAARDGDTVARVGADEFALLLRRLERPGDAELAARALLEDLRRPFLVHGQELHVSASIGVSLRHTESEDAAALLRRADMAVASAKESGRDNLQLYAQAMSARASERLALEVSLRKALAGGEFTLHYQPVVDLADGRVRQLEALVRWQHPHRGLLQPDEFLYVAEGMGMADGLDLWVVRQACAQAQAWRTGGLGALRVAVNMSARAFQNPGMVSRVAEVLRETGLDPAALELEITETVAMRSPDATLLVLGGLRELGVRVAIDDFGTGHSSLSYLRRLPVDYLKIDRSFVHDMAADDDAAAVTAAIIALAHSLRLGVVAEGVETEAQRAMLIRHRCDQMQGFLVSRPLPAESCARFLAAWPSARPGPRVTPTRWLRRLTPT